MKKLLIALVVCAVLVLALPVSNLIIKMPPNTLSKMKPADPLFAKVAPILAEKCVNCHSEEYRLPFYAKFPVAKGIIEQDMLMGLRAFDLMAGLKDAETKPAPEPVLAMIEHVVSLGTMPPSHYLLLHWNHALSEQEKADLQAWVRETRIKHYGTEGVAEAHAGGVIQPIPQSVPGDPAKITLGDKLYHDTRLSGDNTLSCASCHGLDKGGTDQARFSTGIRGQMGDINAPTTLNAGFQFMQFWDGRAPTLAAQADGPVNNPIEMGSNWAEAVPKLQQDAVLMQEFTAVYPEGPGKETVTDAIAAFEQSLITPNSAVDRYLMGDEQALNADEKRGMELFLAHGCAMCHVGKLLGGQSFELMGVRRDYFKDRGGVQKPDYGRFNFTQNERDRFKLKVPTLRNIALTFPYFHDGSTSDLKEAVAVMAKYQRGLDLPDRELEQITAFLKALTGELRGKKL